MLAAGRVRPKKNKTDKQTRNKSRPTQKTPRNPSSATATTSRRRATKHAIRVSPNSPASIDPGLCGNRPRTALAISKNDERYTYTDTQTDTERQTD